MDIPATVIERLRQARHVAVLTGAGISAESGIPTFRDALTGLWARYDPYELATSDAFRRNPQLVWEWNMWRRGLVERAEPNAAHRALAALERRVPQCTLITQNIDGLHQRAGSRAVVELHGNLMRTRCFEEGIVVDTWAPGDDGMPRCPHCGARLRPNVVWFGEPLPHDALQRALSAARACDVFMSIGTSGQVEPAASLPRWALEAGAFLVVINPEQPEQPSSEQRMSFVLREKAGTALPALVRAAWPGTQEEP